MAGNGRWVSMTLKRPKRKGQTKGNRQAPNPMKPEHEEVEAERDYEDDVDGEEDVEVLLFEIAVFRF